MSITIVHCSIVLLAAVSPFLLSVKAQSQCSAGDIRLVGGSGPHEGRVEVFVNGKWGTVCDDSWSANDAIVVCRQLGYTSSGATALSNAHFGQGSDDIVMDDVACSGSESKLTYCSYTSSHNCGHNEDASVQCQQSIIGVCSHTTACTAYRNVIRTISTLTYSACGFLWLSRCSRRVYRTTVVSQSYTSYKSETACCTGYIGDGQSCSPVCSGGCNNGWCSSPGICTCNSGWTGTRCTTAICNPHCVNGICSRPGLCTCSSGWVGGYCQIEQCTGREGELRLAGGTDLSGRVEVCVSGQWGTVCDDYWTVVDASVACYQLGLSRISADAFTFRTPGTGPIHMDNVGCTGSESRLAACPHTSDHNCGHTEDAGVVCQQRLCADGAVHLVSSDIVTGAIVRGRVEVCLNETWGTVCDQSWSREDAKVICGQLGFMQSGALSYSDALFGQGSGPIFLNNIVCTGDELALLDCGSDPIGTTGSCTHKDDAGVQCRNTTCTNGELTLVDGWSEHEGRLEVCHNNQWGTVCDDLWTDGSTQVACRQLGIHDITHVTRLGNNIFSTASPQVSILLDDVRCTGSETNLLSCPRRPIGQENCGHSEDISLRCGICTEGNVRLMDGASQNEGRVEVCVSGRWGTVCDDGWSYYDAQVVCRQLGYPTAGAKALLGHTFTPTYSLPIVMDAVSCGSTEATLSDCVHRNSSNLRSCTHREDARIQCPLSTPGAPLSVQELSITSTSIEIAWSHPSPSVPPSAPVTQYSAVCSASGQPSRSAQTSTSVTSITIVGLNPYTQYSCCVEADSSAGAGVSSCISRQTNEASPSDPPQNVIGVPTSSRSISLSWQPPSIPNGVIRQYRVSFTEQDSSQSWQLTTTSLGRQITGLHPYYTYSVRVAAVTIAEGPNSSVIQIQTYQDVPSGPPSSPLSRDVTSTSFKLVWQPPPVQTRNGIITHYKLRLENQRTGLAHFITIHSSSLSHNAVGLNPYTSYDCSVAALTVNGTGPYSSEHAVQTSEDAPSAPPLSPQHNVERSTRLTLMWSAPSLQYINGVIRHYSIQLNDTTGIRTTTGTSYTIHNLHPYYIYQYRVAAFTVRLGPYSQWQSVRMLQARPSGSPQNVRVTQRQLTSITLEWQPPLSYQQNGIITTYTVQITQLGESLSTVTTTGLRITISSLLPNSLYSFMVAASTAVGRGPYTSPSLNVRTLSPAVTSPPQDVTVMVLDHERLHVTWSPPPASEQSGDITSYTVRVTEIDSGQTWENNTNLVTQWTLGNLHPYYTYAVQVKAVPASGSGLYSDVINATTLPSEPSGAPEITYTDTTTHSVLLRWRPLPLNQQNGIISGYVIHYLEDGQEQSVSVPSYVLEYTFEAVPYTEYVLSVAAVNSVGLGPFSATVEVRTPEDNPTHQPRSLMGVALNSTSIHLTWDSPPEEHHNGEIDSYTVLCSEMNSGGSLSRHSTPTTNITITGLHPYFTYHCNVSAVTVGHGPFSTVTSITTLEDAPSGSPTNLTATDTGPDFVSLSWIPPDLAQQNGIIRHYLINAYPINSSAPDVSQSTPSSSISHTLGALQPYTLYSISVAAVTIVTGPSSTPIEVETSEDVPSGSPDTVTLTPLSPYRLSVMWQAPPVETQNGEIRYYVVKVIEEVTMAETLLNTSDDSTVFFLDELHPYYHYIITVAAASVGIGPFSSQSTVHMPATAPSRPPLEIKGRALTSSSILVQWDPPPVEHQNGEIESYIILCIEHNTGRTLRLDTTPITNVTISELHPFYSYVCNVSAVTVDSGPFSDTINVTTLEDVPSAAPFNLVIEEISSHNISLTWSGPDIQQRNGIIRTYIIYVVPRESSWLKESIHTTQSPEQYTIIGLHPYTTYDIYVAAVTIAQGPNSTQLFVQTEEEVPSSPPVGLSVIPLTPQDLLVSWQAPPRELQNGLIRSYTIQLLTVATGILTLRNSSSLNVTIKSLHPHYEYEISVAASTVGLGPYSTEITVIMPESEPSGPPTITATKASSDSIYLRWSPPPLEDQNGIITGYVIDSLSNRKNISVSVNLTEHILEAFPYTGYQLRVAALNSIGQGPFSGVVNVETLQDAPSHTPISLRGVVFNSSSIELEWEPPPPQHQNGEIVSYTLLCSEIDSDGMVTKHISTTTMITITGLHPYYTYNCSVAAVTVGQGPFSDPVSITTLEDAPSGRPHNITVLNVTSNSIYLSWTAPDPSQQNGVIWRYLIYLTANDYSITYSTSSTTYNLTDLNPYTSYQVKVAAVTISPGPNSTAETIKTGETVPTVPPQDVLVNPISSHNLSVTWRAPRRENRNGEIRHYNVTVLEVATGNQSWYITPDSSAHFTITVLHPYYSYHIYVAAITIGLGPFTPKVTVRMPQAAPSSPPLNVSLVEKGSNYILLQWLPPIDMYRNGIIRHYFIILKESNGSGVFNHTTPTSQPSGNVGSLQPDTEYTCSVAAVTVSTGPLSPAITFTTEPDVPGTVQSLMAVAVSSRSMIISWQPPIEEERNGQIIEYNVNITLYKGTGESYMTTSVSTSVVVNSLHPNYVYQCFVASRTSAGLGPLNQVVLKLPPDAPTGHPQDIKAVASDSNTLHIYWSPPVLDQQNGDITQYGINITDVESGIVSQYNTSGPITSHIVFELLSYNVYQYTVTAFTVIGHGPYSPVYTVRMPSAAPTSPPLNLSLDELGSTYALLRWSPPPQNERNGAIQNYQISLNSSVGSNLNLTTAGSQLYILLDFLVPNTGYTCTVAAVTVSPGPTSAPLQFTTSISVPETVQSLRGIVLSPRSLNLSWQPPLLMSGPNLNYRINITPLNGHSGFRTILTNSTSVVIDMLHPASFYLCLVTSRSGTGLWQPTSILLELPPDVPSGYPRNVFAVASDSKTLYITWSPPLREDQNGNILHYGINITDLQSGEVTQFTTSDSVTSIVIQHLHPHYYYNYTITAFTSVGNGPYSPSNSIQMPQDVPDAPPINLTVTNVAPGIVSLHWFSPPLENQNGHIIGYIVRIIDLDPVKIVDIEIDTTTTKTNKGGLKTTHPYNFSVAAITEQGWGPFSHPISIVTLHGVPSAPTGVIAGRVTATQMNVSWSLLEKPFEPILYYTVKYYPLNRNLQSRTAVEYTDQMVNTTKNLTIDDLYPTFAYNVSVAANTAAGTGNFSEDIFVGLSENSLFQLFFNGAIDCQEWILHHIDTKLQSTKSALSHELEKSCQCHFSWDYVLFNQPHCISAHTNWLILWGRIVGPNSTKSTDILKHLQKWSDMESKIAVEGVHLTTLNFCTVSLKEGESLFCETPAQAPNGVDINSQNESTSPVTYIIVGMVALMLMLIFAIVVCLATVSFYKKKKVRDRQMRFHSSHPLDTIHNSAIPSSSAAKFKGEDDSNVYDQTDSIYETIMDDISPYSELQLQAPLSSESHMHTTQPPMEKQKRSSKSDDYSKYFSVEDHSQCCASQVPYDIIKPDTTFTPDYDTVSVDECKPSELEFSKECKPSELECLDDYVPMFHEEDSMEADKSISFYQNLLCESSDANNVYQVPRPYIKMDTESANKDQDKRLSDCSDCGNTRGDVGATGENKMEPKDSGDM